MPDNQKVDADDDDDDDDDDGDGDANRIESNHDLNGIESNRIQ